MMKKNKLIGLLIILILFFVLFPFVYLKVNGESGILGTLGMATIIILSSIAIYMYNEEPSEHH